MSRINYTLDANYYIINLERWRAHLLNKQLNKNTMKQVEIQVPEGYEIDKEKSTFEKIIFKKKTKKNLTWEEIQDGHCQQDTTQYCLDLYGYIEDVEMDNETNISACRTHLPSGRTAERIRALCQLHIIAEYYNNNAESQENQGIIPYFDRTSGKVFGMYSEISNTSISCMPLFVNKEIMLAAYEANKEIFETALKA